MQKVMTVGTCGFGIGHPLVQGLAGCKGLQVLWCADDKEGSVGFAREQIAEDPPVAVVIRKGWPGTDLVVDTIKSRQLRVIVVTAADGASASQIEADIFRKYREPTTKKRRRSQPLLRPAPAPG